MIKTGSSDFALLRPGILRTYERGGGAHTTPLVSLSMGARVFINGITSFDPGAALPFHCHNCEESVVLLEGKAALDIDGGQHILQVFDTTWIPPNVPHRFRNLSHTKPMKILWIYGSVNATRTLTESGITTSISMEKKEAKRKRNEVGKQFG
jgi:quercetin dioxygenase-like cupin family protein